ncbi:MAG: flippase [Bacteroidetes bacterium]|nr:flippase [Bacteroidota bacterium]
MKRLSQNLLSLLTADIGRRLFGFVAVAYLARVLGRGDFGSINLAFAVLAYGMVLSAAGFPTIGTKKVAQGAPSEIVGEVIGSRLVSTILVVSIIIAVVMIGVQDNIITWLIVLFLAALIPQIFFVDWFFQGKETMGIVSAGRLLQAFVYLAVVLVFVKTPADIFWVAVGSISGEIAASVFLYSGFRRRYPDVKIRLSPSFQLFKQSAPLAIGIVLTTLMVNYPILVLGILKTSSDVGIYSASSKLVYTLMMGDRILILLLLPASARKFYESSDKFRELLKDTLRWIIVIGLPVAAGGMIVAGDMINIIFGVDYDLSIPVLQVFIWYFFLTMIHTVFTSGVIGAGGEKSYGKVMIATAAAYFIAVTAGAYFFGPIGAAFGVVAAEGFSVIFLNRVMHSLAPLQRPEKILRVIISALLMAIVVSYILQYGFVWAVLGGALSYSFFIILLRAVTPDDVKKLFERF